MQQFAEGFRERFFPLMRFVCFSWFNTEQAISYHSYHLPNNVTALSKKKRPTSLKAHCFNVFHHQSHSGTMHIHAHVKCCELSKSTESTSIGPLVIFFLTLVESRHYPSCRCARRAARSMRPQVAVRCCKKPPNQNQNKPKTIQSSKKYLGNPWNIDRISLKQDSS